MADQLAKKRDEKIERQRKDREMAERVAKEEVAKHEQAKKDAAAAAGSSSTAAYHVTVPAGVFTGMQFKVDVNGTQYTVTCPQNARPGQKIKIELPTGVSTSGRTAKDLSTSKPNIDTAAAASGGTNTMHYVTVPQGVYAGMPFQVKVNGQVMRVTCPPNASPGQKIQIALPPSNNTSSSSQTSSSHTSSTNSRKQSRTTITITKTIWWYTII
jgi:hypothetical protein